MKIYKLVICYNEKDEQLEYIEESVEDDDYQEPLMLGTIDLSEVFEEYEEFAKHFTGEIGKA